jgi:hypothetical protein
MVFMKKLLVLLAVCSFYCCRQKADKAGEKEKPIDYKDFMGMFAPLKLSVSFGDSSLVKKPADSAITASALRQFIPDSVFTKHWGKNTKSKFYASGKVEVKKGETYYFLKYIGSKKALYVMGFSREGHFKAILPLVYQDDEPGTRSFASMDNRYTITVNRQRREKSNNYYRKSIYVFNEDAGVFTLILKESNEEKPRQSEVYNPIDSFSHKRKYTGDYIQDKRNFISVRDGRSNSVVRFFVHFEKNKGDCIGELKGEARFVSPGVARYSASGDPCSVQFTFTDKNVRMKELEGCGNHRGIRCYFEGVYNKHKAAKPKPVKSKGKKTTK